ncbi:MAG: hypothetical protein R3236_06850 [Phycisphaeraceae bacterium]|nr:hypothetical protein [Phycisphaeraceae bacterium]
MIRTAPCWILIMVTGCQTAPSSQAPPAQPKFQSWFELDQDQVHFVVWNTDETPIKVRIVDARTMGRTIHLHEGESPGMAYAPCLAKFHGNEQTLQPNGRWRHTFKAQSVKPNESIEYSVTVRVGRQTLERDFRFQGKEFSDLEKRMQAVWKNDADKLNAPPSDPSSPKTP